MITTLAKHLQANIQTYLLIVGMIVFTVGIFGCWGLYVGLVVTGLQLVGLAYLINYERRVNYRS